MLSRPLLQRYQWIKLRLRMENFLRHSRLGVRRLIRLRAGCERLQVERGRQIGQRRILRVCLNCDSGEVEDVTHFLGGGCSALEVTMETMWREVFAIMNPYMGCRIRHLSVGARVDWLLRSEPNLDAFKWVALQRRIVRGLRELMQARELV